MKPLSLIASAARRRAESLVPLSSKAEDHVGRLRALLSRLGRRHRRAVVATKISLLLLAAGGAFYVRQSFSTQTYRVAYVERCLKPPFQRVHQLSLDTFFGELEAEFADVRFEIEYLCNGGEPEESERIYRGLELRDDVVLVIDNTWGQELSRAAGSIINAGIPVIAINADKDGVDYGSNVVFIGHDDHVPGKVANFSSSILKNDEVIFVAEVNYPATRQYEAEFEFRQTRVARIDLVRTPPDTTGKRKIDEGERLRLTLALDAAIAHLRQRQKTPTVIIGTHAEWGDVIIDHVDRNHDGIILLGGPYIASNTDFTRFGRANTNNKAIIFTRPGDAITHKVYNHRKKFRARDKVAQFTHADQLFIKRCLDAVSIVREVSHQGSVDKTALSRGYFLRFFKERLAGKTIASKYDHYSFNGSLLLADERSFEVYSRGESYTHHEQLKTRGPLTPNADTPVPNIYFGVEILSISNIDMEGKSFHAEFYYRLAYDKKYAEQYANIQDYVHLRNAKSQSPPHEVPIDENEGDPMRHRLFRGSGDFNIDADFGKFPLDVQDLKIQVEIIKPDDKVNISFDYRSIEDSKRQADLTLYEWHKEDFYVTVDTFSSAMFRGGTYMENKEPQRVKSLTTHIQIRRDLRGPLVTIFLPLVMIGVAAICLLYVKDSSFAHIGEGGVGLFLGAVSYSIAFAQMTPRSNVLTIADLLFYGTLLTVLLVSLKIIFFNSAMADARAREWMAQRATTIGHTALLGYVLMVALIIICGLA